MSRRAVPRASSALLLALVLANLATAPVLADANEAYKRGIAAIEQKRWAEAATQLRLAIAEKPEAGSLLGVFRRYTPHY
ncbi:MAG TPA: hypothetical protein VN923_03995, partial [Thermoanaerobaculia bacterium]|nr:hypothetical protein [Thermoanaerobaculia bacterium]